MGRWRCSGEQGSFAPLTYQGSTKNDVIQIEPAVLSALRCLSAYLLWRARVSPVFWPSTASAKLSWAFLFVSNLLVFVSFAEMVASARDPTIPLSHYRRRRPDPGPPLNVTCRICNLIARRACSVCTMSMWIVWYIEGVRQEEWRRIPRGLCETRSPDATERLTT